MEDKLRDRLEGIRSWLDADQAILREERHLDAGSSERVYWHHGYAMALADILTLMTGDRPQVIQTGQESSNKPVGRSG